MPITGKYILLKLFFIFQSGYSKVMGGEISVADANNMYMYIILINIYKYIYV